MLEIRVSRQILYFIAFEYLVDGGLASSEIALIRSNQCLGVGLQSFTQYARKDLICDREKAYIPIVAANGGVSLFADRRQSTKVPIAGNAFFPGTLLTNSSPSALNNSAERPSGPAAGCF